MKKSSGDRYQQLADLLAHLHKSPHYSAEYAFSAPVRDELMGIVGEEGMEMLSFTMNICAMWIRRNSLNWRAATRAVGKAQGGLKRVVEGLNKLPIEVLWGPKSKKTGSIQRMVDDTSDAVQDLEALLDTTSASTRGRKGKIGRRRETWQSFLGFMAGATIKQAGWPISTERGSKLVRTVALCLSEIEVNGTRPYNLTTIERARKQISTAEETAQRILRNLSPHDRAKK